MTVIVLVRVNTLVLGMTHATQVRQFCPQKHRRLAAKTDGTAFRMMVRTGAGRKGRWSRQQGPHHPVLASGMFYYFFLYYFL